MTEYSMSDKFVITGIQLGMLHDLTGYDDTATEIVENVLTHPIKEESQ